MVATVLFVFASVLVAAASAVTAKPAASSWWFAVPPSCAAADKDVREAADVRAILADGTILGVTAIESPGMVGSCIATVIAPAESGAPTSVVPASAEAHLDGSFRILFRSQERFTAAKAEDSWLLVQGDYASLLRVLPATMEPEFVSNRRLLPTKRMAGRPAVPAVKNEVIEELVAQVSQPHIIEFLELLTGNFWTRLSTSEDVFDAAQFLEQQYNQRLVNATEWTYNFPLNYPPNIIGEIRGVGNPDRYVVLGAHFDCRAQNINDPEARAPGANDDGSGTAALLEVARILGSSGVRFNYSILFASFSGEEQGLYGSNAYADYLLSIDTDIVAMIQSDMIAHKFPASPAAMELTTRYASEDLNEEVELISTQYVPSLQVGRTTACCSDQQQFYENGYYATALVERGGYTIDPQYHTTTDVMYRDDYSFEQLALITQVLIATAATFAQPL